jgi:hypothetical protein
MFYLAGLGYEHFYEDQFVSARFRVIQRFPWFPRRFLQIATPYAGATYYSMYPLQNRFLSQCPLWPGSTAPARCLCTAPDFRGFPESILLTPAAWRRTFRILDRNAFGNYRQLLYEITLNPADGQLSDMAGNNAGNPNENYAREVLQLFSIGLNRLNENGTPCAGSIWTARSCLRSNTRECVRSRFYRMEFRSGGRRPES